MGLLIFFRRTLGCTFQLRSKVHWAKYFSPSVFTRKYLWSFLQGALSASHRHLDQECYPFYFISVDLFPHKVMLSFWNPWAFLARTTSAARTPMAQLHANAKYHHFLFKSATYNLHLVFLVSLLKNPALWNYLLFIPLSLSLMNTLRNTSLYRDS